MSLRGKQALALLLSLFTSVALVVVPFTTAKLTNYGPYNTTQRTIYATVSTIAATVITSLIVSGIVHSWLDRIDQNISNPDVDLKKLDSSWRTILQIGSLRDNFFSWKIPSSLILISLITTSLVAGFTPTVVTRSISYTPKIPSGEPYRFAHSFDSRPDGDYCWQLSNGSYFCMQPSVAGSPSRKAIQLMGRINVDSPSEYAYIDAGVAVHPSAIGTSLSIYSADENVADTLSQKLVEAHSNILETTQCIPVMNYTPFHCRKGGNTTITRSTLGVTSDRGDCTVVATLADWLNPLTGSGVFVNKICPHGQVGEATIVMAASWTYSHWLAVAVGDRETQSNVPGSTYAVTCDVDTRNAFSYQKVHLGLHQNGTFGRKLWASDEPCLPKHPSTMTDVLFSISAVSSWQPLGENAAIGGWFNSINQVTTVGGNGFGLPLSESVRSPPWAFPNSQNALDDVLGLVAALVSSRIPLNATLTETTGSALVEFTRIGTGKPFSTFFAIPSVFSFLLICYFMIAPRSEIPHYSSSKLTDLVQFGVDREKRGSFARTSPPYSMYPTLPPVSPSPSIPFQSPYSPSYRY